MHEPDFSTSHYDVLLLRPDASTEEVRRAWRQLARQHHPDRSSASDARVMQRINRAYEVLINSHQRAQHDVDLQRARRASHSASHPSPLRHMPLPVWVLAGLAALVASTLVWTSLRPAGSAPPDVGAAASAAGAMADAPLALVPAYRLDSWKATAQEHTASR